MLDISALHEIIQLLRKHRYSQYSVAKLYEFGLSLGLLVPTLETIKNTNANDVNAFLRECLSAWLRQDDNVKSQGGPTYESLIAALKSIGEIAVADAIDREKHPACMIFADHYSTLLQSIQCSVIISVAELLHNEKVLSQDTFAKVKSTRGSSPERKEALLKEVQKAVCSNHQNLETFANLLRQKDSAAVPVVDDILKKYEVYFTDDSEVELVIDEDNCIPEESSGSSNATNEKKASNQIFVPRRWRREFNEMRMEFGSMFSNVRNAIRQHSPPIPIDDIKEHLEDCFPHLSTRLVHAQSLSDILKIVREMCTLIDISILEGIVSQFNIKEAEIHIQKYKESIATFCGKVKVLLCVKEVFDVVKGPSRLRRETVTILLGWNAENHILDDVRDFIGEELGDEMIISSIKTIKSIEVTCFFPVSSTATLIARAQANLTVLKEKGLLQLTIGYYTVYDYSSNDEVVRLDEQLGPVQNDQDSVMSLRLQLQENTNQQLTEEILSTSISEVQSQIVEEKAKDSVEQPTEQQQPTNTCIGKTDEQHRESLPGRHLLRKEPRLSGVSLGDSALTQMKKEEKSQDLLTEITEENSQFKLQLLKNEFKNLKRLQLKEKEEYIETLDTPESELREKLLARQKQTQAMILENEQLESSLQTKAGLEEALVESKKETELLQEKVSSTLSVQEIERDDKIQSLQSQQVEIRAQLDNDEEKSATLITEKDQSSLQSEQKVDPTEDRLSRMESLQLFQFVIEKGKELDIPAINEILSMPLHTTSEISSALNVFVSCVQKDPALLARLRQARKEYEETRTIDANEIKDRLSDIGIKISDADSEKWIDKDGDVKIGWEEWRDFFQSFTSNMYNWEDIFNHDTFGKYLDTPLIPDELSAEEKVSGIWWRPFIAIVGAVAVSRTCTAPLDRLKVFFQVQSMYGKVYTIRSCLEDMLAEGGARSLWRGNGTNVLKIAPETALKFFAFEKTKALLKKGDQPLRGYERLLAGSTAGVIAQTAIYPMEVLKTRLALGTTGQYTGIGDCFSKIRMYEGYRGFYRGLTPSLLGIIPYAGIDLAVYETLKNLWLKHHKQDSPGVLIPLICGTVSSTCGQLVSYPLSLVRTRLQAQTSYVRGSETGMINTVYVIATQEGVRGLYRGLIPNFLKVIPAVSIGYVVYEQFKLLLNVSSVK